MKISEKKLMDAYKAAIKEARNRNPDAHHMAPVLLREIEAAIDALNVTGMGGLLDVLEEAEVVLAGADSTIRLLEINKREKTGVADRCGAVAGKLRDQLSTWREE